MSNLMIKRGSTEVLSVFATDKDTGNAVDLTGYTGTIRFSLNQNQPTADLEVIGTLAGTPNNQIDFGLSATDTASLESGSYFWDVKLVKAGLPEITELGKAVVTNPTVAP